MKENKKGFPVLMLMIGIIVIIVAIIFCVIATKNKDNYDTYHIDVSKSVDWQEYVKTFNEYASENELKLLPVEIEDQDDLTFVSADIEGLRGTIWIDTGYIDSVDIAALTFEQVEPYLYGLLMAYDKNVDPETVHNLLVGLDVKQDGYNVHIDETIVPLDNVSGSICKAGGLYDINLYSNNYIY